MIAPPSGPFATTVRSAGWPALNAVMKQVNPAESKLLDMLTVTVPQSPFGAGVGVIVADLDFAAQDRIRRVLPSLANRRPSAYRW